MSGVLAKALGKRLSLFIKNYTRDNFTLSFFKGEADLRNVVLNESVLQEILGLPHLIIQSAVCNSIHARISWKRLMHDPVVLSGDRLEIVAVEPEILQPIPVTLPNRRRQDEKKGLVDKVIDGMTIEFSEVHLRILPLGRDNLHLSAPVFFTSEMKNVRIYTTNSSWKKVDLQEARKTNKGKTEILQFREVACDTMTALVHPPNFLENSQFKPFVILKDCPVVLRISSKIRAFGQELLNSKVDMYLNSLPIHLDSFQWKMLVDFVSIVSDIFSKVLPPEFRKVVLSGKEQKMLEKRMKRRLRKEKKLAKKMKVDGSSEEEKKKIKSKPTVWKRFKNIVSKRKRAQIREVESFDVGDEDFSEEEEEEDKDDSSVITSSSSGVTMSTGFEDDELSSHDMKELEEVFDPDTMCVFTETEDINMTSYNFHFGCCEANLLDESNDCFSVACWQDMLLSVVVSPTTQGTSPGVKETESVVQLHLFNLEVFEKLPASKSVRKHPSYLYAVSTVQDTSGNDQVMETLRLKYSIRRSWKENSTGNKLIGKNKLVESHLYPVRCVYDRLFAERISSFVGSDALLPFEGNVEENIEKLLEECLYDRLGFVVEADDFSVLLPPYSGHRGPDSVASQVACARFRRLRLVSDPEPQGGIGVGESVGRGTTMLSSSFPNEENDFSSRFNEITTYGENCVVPQPDQEDLMHVQVKDLTLSIMPSPEQDEEILLHPVSVIATSAIYQWFNSDAIGIPQVQVAVEVSPSNVRLTKMQYEYLCTIAEERLLLRAFSSRGNDQIENGDIETTTAPSPPVPVFFFGRVRKGTLELVPSSYQEATLPSNESDQVLASLAFNELDLCYEGNLSNHVTKASLNQFRVHTPRHYQSPFYVLLTTSRREEDVFKYGFAARYVCPRKRKWQIVEDILSPTEEISDRSVVITSLQGVRVGLILQTLSEIQNFFVESSVSSVGSRPVTKMKKSGGKSKRPVDLEVHSTSCEVLFADTPETPECIPLVISDMKLTRVKTVDGYSDESYIIEGERLQLYSLLWENRTLTREVLSEEFPLTAHIHRVGKGRKKTRVDFDVDDAVLLITRAQYTLILNIIEHQLANIQKVAGEGTGVVDDRIIFRKKPHRPSLREVRETLLSSTFNLDMGKRKRVISSGTSQAVDPDFELSGKLRDVVIYLKEQAIVDGKQPLKLEEVTWETFSRICVKRVQMNGQKMESNAHYVIRVGEAEVVDMKSSSRVCPISVALCPRVEELARNLFEEYIPGKSTRYSTDSEGGDLLKLTVDQNSEERGTALNKWVAEMTPVRVTYVSELVESLRAFFMLSEDQKLLKARYAMMKRELQELFAEGLMAEEGLSQDLPDSNLLLSPPRRKTRLSFSSPKPRGDVKKDVSHIIKCVVEHPLVLFPERHSEDMFVILELSFEQLFLSNDNVSVYDPDIQRLDCVVRGVEATLESMNVRNRAIRQNFTILHPMNMNSFVLAKPKSYRKVPYAQWYCDIDEMRGVMSVKVFETVLRITNKYVQYILQEIEEMAQKEAHNRAGSVVEKTNVDTLFECNVKYVDIALVSDYVAELELFYTHLKDFTVSGTIENNTVCLRSDAGVELLVNNLNFMVPEPVVDAVQCAVVFKQGFSWDEEGNATNKKAMELEFVTLEPFEVNITRETAQHLLEIARLVEGSRDETAMTSFSHFHYLIWNRTEVDVILNQAGTNPEQARLVRSGEKVAFSFTNPFLPKLVDAIPVGWTVVERFPLDVVGSTRISVFSSSSQTGSISVPSSRLLTAPPMFSPQMFSPETITERVDDSSNGPLLQGEYVSVDREAEEHPTDKEHSKKFEELFKKSHVSVNALTREIIVSVRRQGLQRVVELRTSYVVKNYLSIPIQLKSITSISFAQFRITVEPGQSSPIPFGEKWRDTYFSIRPDEEWNWSENFSTVGWRRHTISRTLTLTSDSYVDKVVALQCSENDDGIAEIAFHPTLMLRNLSCFHIIFYFPNNESGGLMKEYETKAFDFPMEKGNSSVSFRHTEYADWSRAVPLLMDKHTTVKFTRPHQDSAEALETSRSSVDFTVCCERGTQCELTRIVSINSIFLLVNNTDLLLFVKQRGSNDYVTLPSKKKQAFSFQQLSLHQIQVAVGSFVWSEPISVTGPTIRRITILIDGIKVSYAMNMKVMEQDSFSYVITWSPAFHFTNASEQSVLFRMGLSLLPLSPGISTYSALNADAIGVSLAESNVDEDEKKDYHTLPRSESDSQSGWSWEYVPLASVQQQQYYVRLCRGEDSHTLRVSVKQLDSCTYTRVDDATNPPYIIVNETHQVMEFRQSQQGESGEGFSNILQPGSTDSFFWPTELKPRSAQMRFIARTVNRRKTNRGYVVEDDRDMNDHGPWSREFVIDEIGYFRILLAGTGAFYTPSTHSTWFGYGFPPVYASIHAQKETKIVVLSNNAPALEPGALVTTGDFTEKMEGINIFLKIRLPRAEVKVLDEEKNEIVFLTMKEAQGHYCRQPPQESVFLTIEDMQVDNMLEDTEYQVIFTVDKRSTHNLKANMLEIMYERILLEDFIYTQYVGVRALPYIVKIDGEALRRLNNFSVMFQDSRREIEGTSINDSSQLSEGRELIPASYVVRDNAAMMEDVWMEYRTSGKEMYVQHIEVYPLSMTLNIGANEFHLPLMHEATPIEFPSFRMSHLLHDSDVLLKRIVTSYMKRSMTELYKIVGSMDAFGSPLGVLRKIGKGVKDFFVLPFNGLLLDDAPGAFFVGLFKGFVSLVKNLSDAGIVTLIKICNLVSSGVTFLTFDERYKKRKAVTRRNHPTNPWNGLVSGMTELVNGIFEGISGIFVQPVRGAMEEEGHCGVGFLKGCGRGILGVPLKPIDGVFDFLAKLLEGVKNWTDLAYHTGRSVRFGTTIDITAPEVLDRAFLLAGTEHDRVQECIPMKVLTQRGRLRDRLLVITSQSLCFLHGELISEDDAVMPSSVKISLHDIRDIVLPRSDTHIIIRLTKETEKGKTEIRCVLPNRKRTATLISHLFYLAFSRHLSVVSGQWAQTTGSGLRRRRSARRSAEIGQENEMEEVVEEASSGMSSSEMSA